MDDSLREPGMLRVEEAIELSAARSRQQLDPDVHGRTDAAERLEADVVDQPTLNPRHRRARHARCGGEIDLPPGAAEPGGADGGTEPFLVHAGTVRIPTLLALTRVEGDGDGPRRTERTFDIMVLIRARVDKGKVQRGQPGNRVWTVPMAAWTSSVRMLTRRSGTWKKERRAWMAFRGHSTTCSALVP
jgi:hypothetical protein